MFCWCFNDFCQTNYLNIYWTYLHKICRFGRTLAVDERSEVIFFDPSKDVAVATNYLLTESTPFSSHFISETKRHEEWTFPADISSEDIFLTLACDGIRQELQVLR